MKVLLEKTYPMPGSADAAWAVLQDIDAVAGCMPGAKITERIDASHFKGTVGVKFGPASMSFRGDVEILALDAASMTLRLMGKGTDSTGSSGASMDLTARIDAVDAGACNLVGTSEVAMSGKAAAFGGRMMDSVADQVLKQFAANFAARVQAVQAAMPSAPIASAVSVSESVAATPGSGSTAAAASEHAPAAPMNAPDAASTDSMASAAVMSTSPAVTPAPAMPAATAASAATQAAVQAAAQAAALRPASPPAEATQLNATSLIWGAFKDWLRSLFGARRA